MNANRKINILRICCILVIGALSFIQYYLVKNTYELTKEKYHAEVQRAIDAVRTSKELETAATQEIELLKQLTWQYLDKAITKEAFLQSFKHSIDSAKKVLDPFVQKKLKAVPILRRMKYKLAFNEIVVTIANRQDTLLSADSKPLVFFGDSFEASKEDIIASTVSNTTRKQEAKAGSNDDILLKISYNQYLDITHWTSEILKRMALIFFSAFGLMAGVIFLFYRIFKLAIRERKISEMKTDFANNITHELKTPLASVKLILKTLERAEIDAAPDKRKELLQTLARQYDKIQHLVDSVLDSSIAGQLQLPLQTINITDYLYQYTSEPIHPLQVAIEKKPVWLKSNTAALDKILNNLIENATKYAGPDSPISIKSYVVNNAYFIEVADQGPGIDPTYLPHIFDKFYRIPEKNIHSAKGLGIGLYLCRQAATQIGGTITVKSSVGEGCLFTIKLPIHGN
ncbi:sensor histidine kinase [Chitinophaga nivalis]|uniref:histidine kinase n=1 Tax=Chitinophaga nivalis TaxID=2991709 RepID=A0ABT3IMP7_9BACT|nr:HAMP domain-containing sensor histidine kinase [Chitinophaga nivalis]MCW3465127.1 HAMP domain-containing histidine kinase [Chitinophaga nivalis]MCW3485181.1 HAMP domain-containing histidine kinase [Chitinophaga nivalis]